MTSSELKEKIKILAKKVYSEKNKSEDAALAYDELTKFPELKHTIVDLLSSDFDKFLESIDWIVPKPSTFRINLLNGENFILKSKTTNCLAEDNCGIPNSKPKVSLSKLHDENCSPGSGCC